MALYCFIQLWKPLSACNTKHLQTCKTIMLTNSLLCVSVSTETWMSVFRGFTALSKDSCLPGKTKKETARVHSQVPFIKFVSRLRSIENTLQNEHRSNIKLHQSSFFIYRTENNIYIWAIHQNSLKVLRF